MNPADAEEYTAALGQIVGGSYRQIAWAQRVGIPQALGLTTQRWVKERLGGYAKLAAAERREIVLELAEDGFSQRAIADVVGVSHETIRRDMGGTNVPPDTDEDEAYDEETGTNVPGESQDNGLRHVHVTQNSGENEWYTPAEYIKAVRDVLGEIDLDPASCALANLTVQAHQFYDLESDGLKRKWYGRIFMNPPYGQPFIQQFCEKFVRSLDAGDIAEAIVLVNNATETAWFQPMAKRATAIAFPAGRIRFVDKDGSPALSPLQGQAFLYFGPSTKQPAFEQVFSGFGVVR